MLADDFFDSKTRITALRPGEIVLSMSFDFPEILAYTKIHNPAARYQCFPSNSTLLSVNPLVPLTTWCRKSLAKAVSQGHELVSPWRYWNAELGQSQTWLVIVSSLRMMLCALRGSICKIRPLLRLGVMRNCMRAVQL